jgi:solute carrier family 25 folate transporter 32
MTHAQNGGLSPALVETLAGLSAGSIATLTVHPLDIVKTRMQSELDYTTTSQDIYTNSPPLVHRSVASPSAPLTTLSLLRTLTTSTPHPIRALYRGLTPNLIGNASSWASFFFFKSRFERLLASLHSGPSSRPSPDLSLLTPTDYFAASLLAGAATQFLTNPIWVLKTRIVSSDRGTAGAYQGMIEGARRLLRDEGLRGFYRGLGVSLLSVSHGAVQFAVYEPAKRVYFARRDKLLRSLPSSLMDTDTMDGQTDGGGTKGQGKGKITNDATIVLSTVSKLVAGAVTYPLQVLRSRLQNYDAEQRFGEGIRGVVRQLWREEGVRGFYRGIMPGVVRVLPATWVTFLVYENVKYYLPVWVG